MAVEGIKDILLVSEKFERLIIKVYNFSVWIVCWVADVPRGVERGEGDEGDAEVFGEDEGAGGEDEGLGDGEVELEGAEAVEKVKVVHHVRAVSEGHRGRSLTRRSVNHSDNHHCSRLVKQFC